jgi:thymidylate synthase (FAD)
VTEIEWRSEPTVELIDWMPRWTATGDQRIAQAARVSTGTELDAMDVKRNAGLIRMLVRDRHGSPFEHVVLTWRISTHLAVAREFFRHRIASYNETSGRYRKMDPVFYVPPRHRPLVQVGKPGAYRFEPGSDEQYEILVETQKSAAEVAWHDYEQQLDAGIAREVARNVLPLSLYTSFYVTMNLRSFTNFASLRWAHPQAEVPTFPLWEIEQVTRRMENHAASVANTAWKNFNNNGRKPV